MSAERVFERPRVRVLRGAPDDVELAALVAGLVAVGTAAEAAGPAAEDLPRAPGGSAWADPARRVPAARAWRPGPDAWRWSGR